MVPLAGRRGVLAAAQALALFALVASSNMTAEELMANMTEVTPVCGTSKIQPPELAIDGVCRDMDIRYNVRNLELLRNCTVIEGSLHITLIEFVPQSIYDNYSFPELREITGHLMMFKVFGLKTMKNMFPNLSVIRGLDLFFDTYALFIHELRDLEEVGLIGLTNIINGAVRLTNNFRLCYISTIDWANIAKGVSVSEHHFMDNRKENMCPNYCDNSCRLSDGKKHCWSSTDKDCQKNLDCKCPNGQPCMKNGTCCHEYCLAGCTGLTSRHCHVCKNYSMAEDCILSCPMHTYIMAGRRCLTDRECLSLPPLTPNKIQNYLTSNKPKLLRLPNRKECVFKCPINYTANETADRKAECLPCQNTCPKVCNTTTVYNIKDSEQLRNCTKIQGDLDILLYYGGADMDKELTKNLGLIKEVTGYLKIMCSYGLVTLHFLKSLEIIGGERLVNDKYSLVIVDNANLEKLFPEKQMEKLKVLNGSININYNRMLCPSKVDSFLSAINFTIDLKNSTSDGTNKTGGLAPLQNGDMNPCVEEKIKFEITKLTHSNATFVVHTVQHGDHRMIVNYVLLYKEVTSPLVDKNEGRDRCSLNEWMSVLSEEIVDTDNNEIRNLTGAEIANNTLDLNQFNMNITLNITGLRAHKTYVAMISARTLTSTGYTADSDIMYFRTSPSEPDTPTSLKVEANGPNELHVSWQPPLRPNGVIKVYKVFYSPVESVFEEFALRDYCKDPQTDPKLEEKIKIPKDVEKQDKAANNSGCCTCASTDKSAYSADDDSQESEVLFENALMSELFSLGQTCPPGGAPPTPPTTTQAVESTAVAVRRKRSTSFGIDFNNPVTDLNIYVDSNDTEPGASKVFPELGPNDTVVYPHQVEVNDTKITLPNLKHFQAYSIEVMACQDTHPISGPLCSLKSITEGRTQANPDADNLKSSKIVVRVMPNKTNEVSVTWEPPEAPNGRILHYFIKLTKDHEKEGHVFCINSNNSCEYLFQSLSPGNYSIQIKAVSLAGKGSYSEPKYVFVKDEEQGLEGLIIGLIVGPAMIAVILVAIFYYIYHKWKKGSDTIQSTNPNYMATGDLYSPDEWEVSRDNLRLLKELGQGSFGTVYEGLLDDPETHTSKPVAIKTLGDKADFYERLKILKEATTMKVFECHHVVKLIGVVSVGQPAFIIMELMAQGDLRDHLRKCRLDQDEYPDYHPPTVNQTRQMAGEIADGMAYLAHRKIVHRDLAARNCLVAEDGTVKIADFGMARDVYMTDYYRKDNRALLPVRWMAPESLMDGIFTTMSDVWSYGVVLWEMVTLAEQPYQGLGNEEVLRYVTEGRVMNAPLGCPADLYELMRHCWAFKPQKRPTFMNIIERLAPYLNEKFQQVSFFFQEMAKEDINRDLEAGGGAASASDDAESDRRTIKDDPSSDAFQNFDSSSLRVRKTRAEISSASGSLKSSVGTRHLSSEDEDNMYLESCPARISPSPSTPSTSSRSARQLPEPNRHSQSSYSRPVVSHDLSDSDNDIEFESLDEGAVVERDAQYMLSPKDARSSSERLKLLPESSGNQKMKAVGPLTLLAPVALSKDDYTVMSPPAAPNRSQISPSYLFTSPQSPPLQSPLWQGNPASSDSKYRGNPGFPRNGGIRESVWPSALVSPSQEVKIASWLASSPEESIKPLNAISPTSDGSKDSNSSAGSNHRFHTANGHGPYSHQQPALC